MNWKQFERELREGIQHRPGSWTEMARRLSVDQLTVEGYASGHIDIPIEDIPIILEVFGWKIGVLDRPRQDHLSPQNLIDTDPAAQAFTYFGGMEDGQSIPEFIAQMFGGPIDAHFPDSIKAYLRNALDCAMFAGFHWPFLTIALTQLGLAAEVALRTYADLHNISSRNRNGQALPLKNLIRSIHTAEALTDNQLDYWNNLADTRNLLAHPDQEKPIRVGFGVAMPLLSRFTDELRTLFPANPT